MWQWSVLVQCGNTGEHDASCTATFSGHASAGMGKQPEVPSHACLSDCPPARPPREHNGRGDPVRHGPKVLPHKLIFRQDSASGERLPLGRAWLHLGRAWPYLVVFGWAGSDLGFCQERNRASEGVTCDPPTSPPVDTHTSIYSIFTVYIHAYACELDTPAIQHLSVLINTNAHTYTCTLAIYSTHTRSQAHTHTHTHTHTHRHL